MITVFQQLIAPIQPFFDKNCKQISEKCNAKTFSFSDFILKLIWAHATGVPSLKALISELQTNYAAHQLQLSPTPFSTFQEAFLRFELQYIKQAFQAVLLYCPWQRIPAFDEIGICKAIDGSILPNITSMHWAIYKKNKNAARLHLAFEFNRMIPTHFVIQAANSSERHFILQNLEKKVTYIADRGYFSFDLAYRITHTPACFIFRIKHNLKITYHRKLNVSSLKGKIPACFRDLQDRLIRFTNDPNSLVYRLVQFKVDQSEFLICTNRLDLTTLQIITLYAYRWQIELLFKYVKRTMNAIHAFSLSQDGLNFYFYTVMISLLLQLRLRQLCVEQLQNSSNTQLPLASIKHFTHLDQSNDYYGHDSAQWIKGLSKDLHFYWKIDRHWLIHLKNLIALPYDDNAIRFLGKMPIKNRAGR